MRHLVVAAIWSTVALAGCGSEDRPLDRERARTAPSGRQDARIPFYQDNLFQVSRGARLYAWYGCNSCHATTADAGRDLADGSWRYGGDFDAVFASISAGRPGMPAYGPRMATETIWQVTAYVRDMEKQTPAMRRRQGLDRQAEGSGQAP